MPKPLITVVGATGTGKSDLAVRLATTLQSNGKKAEIINADAMQLYRGMDIGTAKINAEQKQNIKHHLLDVLDPSEEASVSTYTKQAHQIITELHADEKIPIIVGGSGLYINSTIYKMQLAPHDPLVRKELEKRLQTHGLESLLAELETRDPQAKKYIDVNNPRRVVRALEVMRITGKTMNLNLPTAPVPLWPTLLINLQEERTSLVQKLDARVEKMWQKGLCAEVANLLAAGAQFGKTASQAIGYAQAIKYLEDKCSEQEAIAETQLLTRRYARRQVSWFKRLPQAVNVESALSMKPDTIKMLLQQLQTLDA